MDGVSVRSRTAASQRIDFLDALRAILMLVGIPYHAGEAYAEKHWVVSGGAFSMPLAVLNLFIHQWRMPAFFFIAGFFALTMLHRRGTRSWMRDRLLRLGIPLATAMLVVIPVEVLLVASRRPDESLLSVALAIGTGHLWFLVALLLYAVTLAAGFSVLRDTNITTHLRRAAAWAGADVVRCFAAVAASGVLVVGLLWLYAESGLRPVAERIVPIDVVQNSPAFVLGLVAASSGWSVLPRLLRFNAPAVAGTAVGTFGLLLVVGLWKDLESPSALILRALCTIVGGIAWTLLILRLANHYASVPRRGVRWLVDASLVVYLLHMPFVLGFQALAIAMNLPAGVAAAATAAGTAVLSIAFYEIVNSIPLARFLFTGRRQRSRTLAGVFAGPG